MKKLGRILVLLMVLLESTAFADSNNSGEVENVALDQCFKFTNTEEGVEISLIHDIDNLGFKSFELVRTNKTNDDGTYTTACVAGKKITFTDYFVAPNNKYEYEICLYKDDWSCKNRPFAIKPDKRFIKEVNPTAGLGEFEILKCPKAIYDEKNHTIEVIGNFEFNESLKNFNKKYSTRNAYCTPCLEYYSPDKTDFISYYLNMIIGRGPQDYAKRIDAKYSGQAYDFAGLNIVLGSRINKKNEPEKYMNFHKIIKPEKFLNKEFPSKIVMPD